MTIRQRQILWFVLIYILSLGSFALLSLFIRTILRWST